MVYYYFIALVYFCDASAPRPPPNKKAPFLQQSKSHNAIGIFGAKPPLPPKSLTDPRLLYRNNNTSSPRPRLLLTPSVIPSTPQSERSQFAQSQHSTKLRIEYAQSYASEELDDDHRIVQATVPSLWNSRIRMLYFQRYTLTINEIAEKVNGINQMLAALGKQRHRLVGKHNEFIFLKQLLLEEQFEGENTTISSA